MTLGQQLNRDPSIDEIAVGDRASRRIACEELLDLVQEHVSLETPVGDGESVMSDLIEDTYGDRARGRDSASGSARRSSPGRSRSSSRGFSASSCSASVSTARRGGRSSRSASSLGITRERVRQLETRALRELRHVAPALELYLRA